MKRTVLTVDDSRTMRDMLRLCLIEAGYAVEEAVDGEDGLIALSRHKPDVIISDINMPRLDGYGFIERVRADAAFNGIPILVLTTESDAAKKDRARAAGATGWIVKPFEPAKLVGALARVLA
ncbi:response regulator [Rubellimicrobium roseum]|uniref:Response regulator n=1 Tax=Rubellimicrobium roseum TaxID=687525 RepID=A0A5C4NEJ9_9RHOB|nr:response regulator [Rubellimicrobium roseum]TNC72350.1 response regulator [Rubellimicrobium roseum]